MSKPKAIPTGILVSASRTVRKPERPTLKRKIVLRKHTRQVPWLWIVTGGSTAAALVILAIGMCINTKKGSPQGEPAFVAQPLAMATFSPAPAPKPIVRETPVVVPKVVGALVEPIVEAPKVARADVQVVKNDKVPAAISVSPEIVANMVTEVIKPQKPKVELIPSPSEPKILDVSPFASCEQIGTKILFMKDPPEAFKRAKAEKKLVFMMHLSGNLEDKGFT